MVWRATAAMLVLACSSCSVLPTSQEKALVTDVERRVKLPKGAGSLKCYERHYALLQGPELDEYMGVPLEGLRGRAVLVGLYRLGKQPGIHWAQNAKMLPAKIADGGCSNINVFHVVGEREKRLDAYCSETFAGVPEEQVSPPVSC